MNDQSIKRFSSAEKVILFTGILLIALSFISEFNFHFIQGFMPDFVDQDIFWRAEMVEVFNSMSFLILGVLLIIIPFIEFEYSFSIGPSFQISCGSPHSWSFYFCTDPYHIILDIHTFDTKLI